MTSLGSSHYSDSEDNQDNLEEVDMGKWGHTGEESSSDHEDA